MPDFVTDHPVYETPLSAAFQGYAATPPGFGQYAGAMFEEGSPIEMGRRAVERGQYPDASFFDRSLAAMGMADSGLPIPSPAPSPMLSPEEYNKRFAPPGTSLGDKPMSEGLARVIGRQKAEQIERDGVLARAAGSYSLPAQFGTGLLAFTLDPLNAATAFLPGIGEEALLERLAAAGAGRGFAARTLARIGAGGTAGAVGQIPLSALKYGFGLEEGSDYDLREAFRDLMYSAAAGAIFHAGFGALGDVVRGAPKPEIPPIKPPDERAPLPLPEEAPPSPFGGPAEEMENPFLRPQPEWEEPAPAPPPARAESVPIVGRELRLSADEAALKAEDANLLRQLRDLPRGGRPAADKLARIDVVNRELADEGLSPEARTALLRRRDELLTDTTPEKLKAEAAPLEARRTLQAQRERIAAKLGAIAAERGQPKLISGLSDIADAMQRVLSADAHTKADAARAALSQILDGREVDVEPFFDPKPLQETAEDQMRVYRDGYAPGIAAADFQQMHDEVYGAPGEEAKKPPSEGERQTVVDEELRNLEKSLAEGEEAGVKMAPEERAEIEQTAEALDAAGAREAAYSEAAQCLIASGL